jgi:osmotically-inducible protein OsmY
MKRAVCATYLGLALCVSAVTGCSTAQSPRRQIDDVAITTEVKTKLASEIGVSSVTDIEVNTTNGVVTLAGQVADLQTKDSAEQIAGSVEGVISVSNNLQVETP